MAVSIDRVYQKVLALANKEQRGYITPQEFNLFADQAQRDIFEQYFFDFNRASRGKPNGLDHMDRATSIEEKISLFEINDAEASADANGIVTLDSYNIYRLGTVRVRANISSGVSNKPLKNAEELTQKQLSIYTMSPLTRAANESGLAGPYYTKYQNGSNQLNIRIYPHPNSTATPLISYIENITAPNWTYSIVGANALHNPNDQNFRNFQLHASEESLLVVKILQLAGISIKDYQLTQTAVQEEVKIKQEKQ